MNNQGKADKDQLLHEYGEGTPVEITREANGSVVLSVRMPRDILRELTRQARSQEKPVGRLARELIELGLATGETASATTVFGVAKRIISEQLNGGSDRTTTEQAAAGIYTIVEFGAAGPRSADANWDALTATVLDVREHTRVPSRVVRASA